MKFSHLGIFTSGNIQLLESVSIPAGTKVLITPIIVDEDSEETENLSIFSLENLNQCYTDDEPEYSLELIDLLRNSKNNFLLT